MGLRNAFRVDIDPADGPARDRRERSGCAAGRVRVAARAAASSGTWSRRPRTWAGRTASATMFRTTTSTSPRARPGPRSTAPISSTTPRTTPASRICRRPSRRWCGTESRSSSEFPEVNTEQGVGSSSPGGGPVFHHDPGLVSDVAVPGLLRRCAVLLRVGPQHALGAAPRRKREPPQAEPAVPPARLQLPDRHRVRPRRCALRAGVGRRLRTRTSIRPRSSCAWSTARAREVNTRRSPWRPPRPTRVRRRSSSTSRAKGPSIPRTTRSPSPGTSSRTGRWIRRIRRPRSRIAANGLYNARLTVTDAHRRAAASRTCRSRSGTRAPTVAFGWPPNGSFFEFGDYVRYQLDVQDPEDGVHRLLRGDLAAGVRSRDARAPAVPATAAAMASSRPRATEATASTRSSSTSSPAATPTTAEPVSGR